MTVKLATLNCRGGTSKIPHICEVVKRHKLDVLNLQEVHNLKKSDIDKLERTTKMKCFTSCGTALARGVLTMVRETEHIKAPTLLSRDQDGNFVAVEVVMFGENFKIHNVYAPNAYGERTRLFSKHAETLEDDTSIIYCGDFNCTQNFELDSLGKSWTQFCAQKSDRRILEEIGTEYGYRDSFRILHSKVKAFTFAGLASYRARLDRVYLHKTNAWRMQSATIHPITFSDHDMYVVELKAELEEDRPVWGRGMWKLNASLLENLNNRSKIERHWIEWRKQKYIFPDQLTWWEHGKRFLKSQLMEIGREEKKKANMKKAQLMEQLREATTSQEMDSATKIRSLKAELAEIEQKEIEGAAVRSRNEWVSCGEKATKHFFSLEKSNGAGKTIKELESNGQVISGKDGILKHVKEHFEKHFTATPIDERARDHLVGTIKKRLTEDESDSLGQPFTMVELEAAHKRMKKGRAPGNDGLTVDFYKSMWNLVKVDLLDTLNETLIRKELPLSMTQSLLTLIFKNKGSKLNLKNYRAISLLNVDFKYLASIVNGRIAPLLPSVVEIDQGGGIKSRLIEDQLIMIQDIYDYYKSRASCAFIEAKDLTSAFDFCSHDYLFRVLRAMKFSDPIIELLKAIDGNMYTAVTINGTKTPYFHLTRSIRQGDPSSVTWFVLAMEPLGNLIRASRSIHPIRIPNQPPKVVNMFVDDTTIFATDPDDHNAVRKLTEIYEAGSGARFNPSKSEVLLLGKWSDINKTKLPQDNVKTNIKLLGVFFGPDSNSLNQEAILQKVDETLDFWKKIPLSFQGKKLIIETKVISQVQHVARITGISRTLQKQLMKRITSFFWHPRKMTLVSMATLQNDTMDGGLGLPNLATLNKAILVERISKALRGDKPWSGQLVYRNGPILRHLHPGLANRASSGTTKQTTVSKTIADAYHELKNKVLDWSAENLKSLQRKLYMKSNIRLRTVRNFSDTWTQISKSTSHRKSRDLCYLVAHDSLPLRGMLKRRNVINYDTCELCGLGPETIRHTFIECAKVQKLKMQLERWIEPLNTRTLSEEEILFHEGRIKFKKKSNALIAQYKHIIWTSRAKLYHGELTRKDVTDYMIRTMSKGK